MDDRSFRLGDHGRYPACAMANKDTSINPYDAPLRTGAVATPKTQQRSNVKSVMLAILCSFVLAFVFAILFALIGRGIALATFESNPNDWYESRYGIEKARAQHVVGYSLNFALAGFLGGISLPWIYLLYSRFCKHSRNHPK